ELADAPERLCEADARVAALQEQLPALQRAAERAGGLQAAQKSLISATHRQRDARTRLERAEQALQGLDAARAALEQAAQRLAEVGAAGGSAAALRPRAAQVEPQTREVRRLEGERSARLAEAAALAAQLEPFADVDALLATAVAERDRTRA